MADITRRLAKLEARAGIVEGERLPVAEGIALTMGEIRSLLFAVDGKTRGLPGDARPLATVH